jgi:hypothetical protein
MKFRTLPSRAGFNARIFAGMAKNAGIGAIRGVFRINQ